jgi:uncharacterized membrane protein
MDEATLARGLGWFSLGLGLMEVAAPKRVAAAVGLDDHSGLIQAFGLREIASGLGLLSGQRTADWLWARVGGDALDLALLGTALGSDNPRRDRALAATAAVAGVTMLDAVCAAKLTGRAEPDEGAVHVTESITIDRPAEELYRFWHGFERLPRFMNHLESVRTLGPNRSHWVAKGPAGMRVEWDAEVVEDRPNEFIAWRSLEGADVDNTGSVRFERAPGGRGTVVRVDMDYWPPAGKIGATVARLFGMAPEKEIIVDLHRLKQWFETGEIATTAGQPAARSGVSRYDEIVQT